MQAMTVFFNVVAGGAVGLFLLILFAVSVRNWLMENDTKYCLSELIAGRGKGYVPLWAWACGFVGIGWFVANWVA